MSEKIQTSTKKSVSADWLVRGVLAKIGETFDRLTGRNWKPSSNLATSELIEKLKNLLDQEARDLSEKGKFVPHNIKLKMQWDKFSTDAEDSLKKLENELMIAAVDHINDRRYQTYAPMKIEIKPDYFTEGVKLMASFEKFAENESEAAINVSVPNLKNIVVNQETETPRPKEKTFEVEFNIINKNKTRRLTFTERQRLSVGRTAENDLQIDDPSVSKIHASLVFNADNQMMVADTGSTNGTFINDSRIAYGKAIIVSENDVLKFGTVEVHFEILADEAEEITVLETQNLSDEANADAPIVQKNADDAQPAINSANTVQISGVKGNFAETPVQTENVASTMPGIKLDLTEEK